MLTLTDEAVAAIADLVAGPEVSDEAGVRIVAGDTADGDELHVHVAARPEPSDETVDTRGVRVFLPADIASRLDDHVLDAVATETGQVRFDVRPATRT